MNIHLSDHFTYKKLLRFSLPSVVMMFVTTVYSMVDGFFVSNFVGKNPFAAVNLIMPLLMSVGAVGLLFGTGGSAYIALKLGEGNRKAANETLTMITVVMLVVGVVFSVLCFIFIEPFSRLLGADDVLLSDCVIYSRVLLCAMPLYMAQNAFQSLMVTAEKPRFGLVISITAGIVNVIGDFLLVYVFPLGIFGAAVATALSWCVGGIIPLVYFAVKNSSTLRFSKPRIRLRILGRVCANGSSEMVSSLSLSFVSIIYNYQLMQYSGANGVAAYGVIMYVSFGFMAFSMGYSISVSPIAGYNLGAANHTELKSLLKKSTIIIAASNMVMVLAAELLAYPMALIFASYDQALLSLTVQAIMLYSVAYLFIGFNTFSSAFFTGLNNGKVSAAISFLRTVGFEIGAIILLPLLFGEGAIWLSAAVAELITLIISLIFFMTNRKRYHYY